MKVVRSILAVFALFFGVSAARAQEGGLQAAVPFNFVAGNKVLPAGHYTLRNWGNSSGVIALKDLDESIDSFSMTTPCSLKQPAKSSKLVFHRVGNEYFLYQVWVEGETTGREFPMSKLEIQMAKNDTRAEEVIVAALLIR
jgi:hypothetical protein